MESRSFGNNFLNWNKGTGELIIDNKPIPGSNIVESLHVFFKNKAKPKDYIPQGHPQFDRLIRKVPALVPHDHTSDPEWLKY